MNLKANISSIQALIICGFLMNTGISTATADEIQVAYKTFYSHVSKLNSDDTQALQFAFGFTHIKTGKLCEINSARISTDKQQIPLVVTSENRFTIPSEKALRLADALIIIDVTEPSNQCDVSVQLETKTEYNKRYYSFEELVFIREQYEAFFNEMGSFLSFMMPTVKGLVVQFEDQSYTTTMANGYTITQGSLTLDEAFFDNKKPINLPIKPLRITALAAN